MAAAGSRYDLRCDGAFVIRDFQRAKPFSSFLPGIAGPYGIPLWLYYVNRGQAVACFGTRDKNHAILEFQSANRHHRRVSQEGFRTFLHLRRGTRDEHYEPFHAGTPREEAESALQIEGHALRLRETNRRLELCTTAEYVAATGQPFAALLRRVRIENTGNSDLAVSVLDGFPMLVPYGLQAALLQKMPFISESYVQVRNLEGRMPFVNLRAVPGDTAETEIVEAGNFFLGWDERGSPLPALVDPATIFGDYQDFSRPWTVLGGQESPESMQQDTVCQTCCAFVRLEAVLRPGAVAVVQEAYGAARRLDELGGIRHAVTAPGFFEAQDEAGRRTIESVRHRLFVHCALPELNRYVPQTCLDNAIRGGLPVSLPAEGRAPIPVYLYSRKHGDLERDYNQFFLADTYLSQGNGNFRDVNQNRRHGVWLNPEIGPGDVEFFWSLIQADGFNPLVIQGVTFSAQEDGGLAAWLSSHLPAPTAEALAVRCRRPFAPGDLFAFLRDRDLPCPLQPAALLAGVLGRCASATDAVHAEGYWIDHWFYNVDLLESFLAIYPDRLSDVLVARRRLTFRDDAVRVRPRSGKQVRLPDGRIRQLGSVFLDEEKAQRIAGRPDLPHVVRVQHGQGQPYRTNLLGVYLCVLINKLAAIAPSGLGVEMEAGRPGWYDSVNGLPALFGSSLSEAFQLLRAIRLLRGWLEACALAADFVQPLPEELADLGGEVDRALQAHARTAAGAGREHAYWGAVNDAKERYRERVRFGFDGREVSWSRDGLAQFLDRAEARLAAIPPLATDPVHDLPSTYFTHDARTWRPRIDGDAAGDAQTPCGAKGYPLVEVTAFEPHRLPPFLEAPVHAMRIAGPDEARRLHAAVRRGPLWDAALGMYRLNAGLAGEAPELGRVSAWPPGWFENENVFVHLGHKYILALLEAGLYEEFHDDLRRSLVCFQDPEVFGRSPLENVSFIVSSSHPRSAYHGRGFLPRSSGTTAEVVNMVLWMSFGKQPFAWRSGRLSLAFRPALCADLFTRETAQRELYDADGNCRVERFPPDSFAALFLGRTVVTYLNPSRRDTYGAGGVRPLRCRVVWNDGRIEKFGPEIPDPAASAVREREACAIEVELG